MLCPGETRNPFLRSHYFSQVIQKIIPHFTKLFFLDSIRFLFYRLRIRSPFRSKRRAVREWAERIVVLALAFPTISISFANVSVNWSRYNVFMRASGAPDYVNNERNWCSPAWLVERAFNPFKRANLVTYSLTGKITDSTN